MSQQFLTEDGVVLLDPGTVVSTTVQSGASGTATSGVITIIGEADAGPGFLDEADVSANIFSPDQFGKVQQKYVSGRIVDAFKQAVEAANDPNIIGSVGAVRIIKSNMSTKASNSILEKIKGTPVYASQLAKKEGFAGNLIKSKSDVSRAETAPTTGLFCYTPAIAGSNAVDLRINGATKMTHTVTAKTSPVDLVTALENVAEGLLAQGGQEKISLPSSSTFSAAAPDTSTLIVTLQATKLWSPAPVIGDVAVIPANSDYGAAQDSAIAGVGGVNVGTYIVTAVTNTATSATVTLKKVYSVGTLAAASGSVSVDKKDLIFFSKIELKNISGDERQSMQDVFGSYNVSLNTGSSVKVDAPAAWNVNPVIGDIMKVETAFGTIQPGFYQITVVTSTSITATRISEGTSGTGTGSVSYASGIEPLVVLAPVVSGLGKTLCIESDVDNIFKNSTGAVAGLSNKQLVSAAEYRNQMTIIKSDVSEQLQAGGDIIITIGCTEEDATLDILTDKIEFFVGASLIFTATFKQFKTMSDLAAFISSQTNWSATVVSAKFNAVAPSKLDKGTFACSGVDKNARIKKDATDWSEIMNGSQFMAFTVSGSGLPEATDSFQFLTGGTKGGTTNAMIVTAIDACEKLDTNFIVPLFSVDADTDIANEQTESTSTYSIAAINAYVKAHVNKMSQVKVKKNRQGIMSVSDTYVNVKEMSGELSAFRCYLTFQNAKIGTTLYQPWMSAITAAGMAAAAGYKGIVKKFASISGISTTTGDFDPSLLGDREDALKAGLLFMQTVPTGGIRWVSDQSTYSIDSNFVYNSMQAVYISDLIALTLIDSFDRLVVGKSIADITATQVESILDANMFNFLRLKWTSQSDDAPKGYKNASVKITGPVCEISVEIKLAGLIYFVPISMAISQVEQTA